jgi:CPA1 family monovalent cation:H+ antiporter
VTLVVVRVAWIFPLAALAQRRGGARPSWQVPAVVSWAGARGVVPLAAALSIPLTTSAGDELPHRDLVLVLAIAVIVTSLVVQGFTLAPLVRRAGIALDPLDVHYERNNARARMAEAGLAHLDELAENESASEFAIEQLRRSWQARLDRILAHGEDHTDRNSITHAYRELRRDLLRVEGAELTRLFEAGAITDVTRRRIQRTLDLENAGLGED